MLNCLKMDFGSGQDSPFAAPSEPPIYSPVINGIGATPHGMNFASFHEPPYNTIESPVPEPAVFGGYSPANSPKFSLSPSDFSIDRRNFTPIVNNTAEPPLRVNFMEPPTSEWLENLTIKRLVQELLFLKHVWMRLRELEQPMGCMEHGHPWIWSNLQ
ncbi:Hypothetical predicted protein [Olea europaea subsp. europaea]|uniref:Uncharacterized protein n=1 Tax=Olea europaea subsp. europaea TaxID=158383 RepID=A0A8S0TBS3_OLEEU|nr:Hypothetical predicted protein [Olea europaea subsp. europaea]